MAEEKSVSLGTLIQQQENLAQAVSTLTAQRTQLEEQLNLVRSQLATNNGALQYANALIQSLTGESDEDPTDVVASAPTIIEDAETELDEATEEVTL